MTQTMATDLDRACQVIKAQKAVLVDQAKEILDLRYELARQKQHTHRRKSDFPPGFMVAK